MKKLLLALLAAVVLTVGITLTVQDMNTCWDSYCDSEETACAADTGCLNAGKYMKICGQNQKCNQNSTDSWNETCWEYCNYEETPATTNKLWLAFEKCHLSACAPKRSLREYIEYKM